MKYCRTNKCISRTEGSLGRECMRKRNMRKKSESETEPEILVWWLEGSGRGYGTEQQREDCTWCL